MKTMECLGRGTEMLRRQWNVWVDSLNVCLVCFIVYIIE
jgi:hypothetical protein